MGDVFGWPLLYKPGRSHQICTALFSHLPPLNDRGMGKMMPLCLLCLFTLYSCWWILLEETKYKSHFQTWRKYKCFVQSDRWQMKMLPDLKLKSSSSRYSISFLSAHLRDPGPLPTHAAQSLNEFVKMRLLLTFIFPAVAVYGKKY